MKPKITMKGRECSDTEQREIVEQGKAQRLNRALSEGKEGF
jgi:hypothetical protein